MISKSNDLLSGLHTAVPRVLAVHTIAENRQTSEYENFLNIRAHQLFAVGSGNALFAYAKTNEVKDERIIPSST